MRLFKRTSDTPTYTSTTAASFSASCYNASENTLWERLRHLFKPSSKAYHELNSTPATSETFPSSTICPMGIGSAPAKVTSGGSSGGILSGTTYVNTSAATTYDERNIKHVLSKLAAKRKYTHSHRRRIRYTLNKWKCKLRKSTKPTNP